MEMAIDTIKYFADAFGLNAGIILGIVIFTQLITVTFEQFYKGWYFSEREEWCLEERKANYKIAIKNIKRFYVAIPLIFGLVVAFPLSKVMEYTTTSQFIAGYLQLSFSYSGVSVLIYSMRKLVIR